MTCNQYDKEDVNSFINYVSQQKKDLDNWSFMHTKVVLKDSKVDLFFEIIQYLEFQFQDTKFRLLKNMETKQALLVTQNKNTEVLIQIDKNIYENFPSDAVRAYTNSFKEGRLEQFSEILSSMIQDKSITSDILLKRLQRPVNTIMVVDDDPMILKQVEKVLQGFGSVIVVQDYQDLLEEYKTHAPNILFLDVHLGKVRGPDLLDKFITKIDPHAHVIMISSDNKQQTIQDAIEKNIKGYVLKPLKQQTLLEHVMKSKTFCARSHK